MAEPTTPNTGLVVPNTGDLVGSWGTSALNPDFVALDGFLGGTATIALTSGSSLTLSTPAGVSIVPSAGPTQSQNAGIILTGTLTNNTVIVLTIPGRYAFFNQCLPWTYYVQVQSVGLGNAVGLPPGEYVELYHDGTNVSYIGLGRTGSRLDLFGITAMPVWMTACSVLPYLVRDGTVYNISQFPYLGGMLGNTFGGNGSTTFAVPDSLARADIAFDTKGTGRLNGGVNAQVMGSAGGDQNLQSHSHGASSSSTDFGHVHPGPGGELFFGNSGGGGLNPGTFGSFFATTGTGNANIQTVTSISPAGAGSGQNVQPSIVSFLPLIKT